MNDILYNIMLHIPYQELSNFLICKDVVFMYYSLFFWKNYTKLTNPLYKVPTVKEYHQIVNANITKDYMLKKNKILSIRCFNLDFLKCIPYACFNIFVSRTEMSVYKFQFYIDTHARKMTYLANNEQYYIKSDPFYFSKDDFQMLMTKLCYYNYKFLT